MNRAYIFIDQLKRVSDDQSQYSRKQNLLLDGFNLKKSDNDRRIRDLVIAEIQRLDLDIDEYDVDRAHRAESPYYDKGGKLHTPVIVRFSSWYARNVMYEARKKSRLYMKADLTARRKDLLNDAKQIFEDDKRAADLIEFVFVDRNCHLSIKTKDERFFKFNSIPEFRSLINYIEDTQPPSLSVWKYHGNSKEPAVVNLHDIRNIRKWLDYDDHVYVGREAGSVKGSPWGNPFRLDEYDVATSLRLYEEHITSDEHLSGMLGTLKHKTLACWCQDPDQCHSSVLLKLIGN